MAPLFADLTMMQHQNAVGVAQGGEPVGDDDGGAFAHQLFHRLLDPDLRRRVDAGRGFVQYQYIGVAGQGTGEGQQLPLSQRQRDPTLADLVVISSR